MKRKIVKSFLLFSSLFVLFLFSSCNEQDIYNPNQVDDTPNSLDFSTTQDVKILVNYDAVKGFGAEFTLYAENPYKSNDEGISILKENLLPVGSGIAVSGKYEKTKKIPAYIKELFLYSPNLFTPTIMYAQVENGVANFTEIAIESDGKNSSAANTRTIQDRKIDYYLGRYTNKIDVNSNHRPEYIDASQTTTIAASILTAIDKTFPEGQKSDPKFYKDASVYLSKSSKVWVSVIGSKCDLNSALSYFYYTGKPEDIKNINYEGKKYVKEHLAFPLAKLRSNSSAPGLKAGEYVQLKYYNETTSTYVDEFPAGVTIGWILRGGGYDISNKTLYTYSDMYYSHANWNPETTAAKKNHTILFNAGTASNPFHCFGFEDRSNDAWGTDGDCNDLIFHVKTNPADAITDVPPIEEPKPDIISYDKSYGILAFEDSWPEKGDYDLNDVVVKYESSVTLLKKGDEETVYATEINDEFSLIHTGADFANKFGLKMDLSPNLIESIHICSDTDPTPTKISPVSDGSGFIIDISKNVKEDIIPYQYGTKPKKYTINIKIKDKAITQSAFNCYAPYNPFISPKEGIEVHLPMYTPTERADESYFGTLADRSNPSTGLYYVSGTNIHYPFAIHLAGTDTFTIPIEKKGIEVTYPKYTEWVNSNFLNQKDWYQHPAQGIVHP